MTYEYREDGPAQLSEVAYDRLKQLVVSGRVRPGRHLVARKVAAQLDMGVMPLRDAMVRLATEGFLDRESTYGFATKELREEEERNILVMCDVLLTAGLRTAGDRMSEEVRLALAALTDTPARTTEEALEIAASIREMYLDVARATGNQVLYNCCRILVERSHLVRLLDLQMEEPGGRTIEDLRAIGIAMTAGDPERAVEASRAILGRRIDRLPILVKEANYVASQAKFP